MKQLLQNLRDGRTIIADVPIPQVQPGTALVRTACSLISAGTERMLVEFAEKSLLEKARSRPDLVRQLVDKARREGILTTLEAAFNKLDQPLPLGYSSSGIIVAVGEGLQDFQPGDRVACSGGNHAVHAEYAIIPSNLLTRLPAEVDFTCGAFTTVGAIALHGFRLANPQIGETVAVIGLGLLGLIAAGIARAAGCKVFGVEIDPQRVLLAQSLGIAAASRQDAESRAAAFTRNKGFDTVLICADSHSNDPIELAAAIAGTRRTIVAVGAVGLNLQRKSFFEKELTFLVSRSYGPGRYDEQYEEKGIDYPHGYVRWTEGRNFAAFLDLQASGKLDVRPLITHTFPIDRAEEAYHLITGKGKEKFLAVLLDYPQPTAETSPSPDQWRIQIQPGEGKTYSQSKAQFSGSLRLGVLGAGNYAQAVFLPNLRKTPGVERVAIASAIGISASHAAHKYKFASSATQEENILNNPQVNTVAILSRHQHHARQVVTAMRNGKHVYCEKPLALNLDELGEITQLLKQPEHPILMIGFNRRFAPFAMQLKAFFEPHTEPLIIHYRVNAGYLPPNHWLHDPLQGGGRIIGEACHFIDFLGYLIGQSPVSVSAFPTPDVDRYHQDNVILTFTYTDGSIGTVSYLANGSKRLPKERVEVFSAGKVGILDDFRHLELIQDNHRRQYHSRLRQDKGHLHAWQAFLLAIEQGGDPPIPYQALIDSSLATLTAAHSAATRQPLSIPHG